MGEKFLPKTFTVLVLLCTVITQHALGQITDNFADGNFTNNPVWSGVTSNYTVNASFQLRLNAMAAGSSYLTTPFNIPTNHNVTWEFFLRQNFAPSGSNYSRVYLMSSQADLTGPLDGYFLQFGEDGANDAIKLFRQTGTTNTLICAGPAATISANPVIVRVRITRNVSGQWVITADYTGGTNFVAVSNGTDNAHTSSSFFGFRSNYTVTNVQNFFYDDVTISTEEAPDEMAPTLSDVTVISPTEVELVFSEELAVSTAEEEANFLVNDNPIVSATLNDDLKTIRIVLSQPLSNGHMFSLNISGVADEAGNVITNIDESFLYFDPVEPQKHDITITEFYPDPNPSVGLPLAEFVEIYNRSAHPFDLAGWKITDQSSIGTLTTKILLPGEYLILCHSSDVAAFQNYGAVMGLTTFPGLNNAGDTIKLLSPDGMAVDSLVYNMSWYHHQEDKQNGGWTLEKINPHDFCKDSDNWTPGTNPVGGTPGQQNSVFAISTDVDGPMLVNAIQVDSAMIQIVFNEKLKNAPLTSGSVMLSPNILIDSISFTNALKSIEIHFTSALDSSAQYALKVYDIYDCPGNSIQTAFDSIIFKLDSIAPSVLDVQVVNDSTINIQLSERLLAADYVAEKFSLANGQIPSRLIKQSAKNFSLVFNPKFINGATQTLSVENISDRAGNLLDSIAFSFMYFESVDASFKDLIISEIFPDPAPTVGLPEAEFIELFNRSGHPFNLQGWQITDGASVGVLSEKILLPNHYVILAPNAHRNSFQGYGEVIGLPVFPSLNNSADHLKLIAPSGSIIDSVNYELKWYHDTGKDDGGYSLEIINPNDFCRGPDNWSASAEITGGTPGKQNSVYSDTPDSTGPELITVVAKDAQSLSFIFNERLQTDLPLATNIQTTPPIEIVNITFGNTGLTSFTTEFVHPLDSAVRYEIKLEGITDCSGNEIQVAFSSASIKLDTLLPQIISLHVHSSNQIDLEFSKKLNSSSASVPSNYVLKNGQHPQQANLKDEKVVKLLFNPSFENGVDQILSASNVKDVFSNTMIPQEILFRYFIPAIAMPKDIVITELFPDPSPQVELPETEFIELFNRSNNAVDVSGWTISDGGNPAVLQSKILLPGNFLILVPPNRSEIFSGYGSTLAVSGFPSLNNATDTVVLKTPSGVTIDSVVYVDDFYRDDEKKEGGWTLEKIDPENICAEDENWIASEDASGGTPGKRNSVDSEMPDLSGPVLLSAFPETSQTVKLSFNEKLKAETPQPSNIHISPPLDISAVEFSDASLRAVLIHLADPMAEGVGYTVTVSDIFDCAGNINLPGEVTFALPQTASASDVVINELLFNPRPAGVDFIECFNNSDKFVNLKNWKLANVENDTIRNKKTISSVDHLLHPQTYIVFTSDAPVLKGEYLSGIESSFVEVALPSFPDDDGSVILLDDHDNVIDSFVYSKDYHSIFLKDEEGVSLERIHVEEPTNLAQNWKSASATVGFATPGYANSNLVAEVVADDPVTVEPEIFSMSGPQNFAEIHYQFERGNLVANVKIIDAQGRELKVLADNELLGASGFLRWDGDTSTGSKARIGTYMIWFEVFDETGRVEVIKKRVVLAERF